MNDTCPHCLRRNNTPRATTTHPAGTRCTYRCRCGHTWTTTWNRHRS